MAEQTLKLKELKILYKKAQETYYVGSPIMSDSKFDKLEDKIRGLDPKWKGLAATGSEKINKKRKVALNEFMPSLTKFYPESIDKWLAKHGNTKLVLDKLDGSSVQAYYESGLLKSLVTRGDGTIGQDITFLANKTLLPQKIDYKKPISFRIEAIMKIKTFESKYSKDAENARNLVAGVLNRKLSKESTKQLEDIDFVVLGVFNHEIAKGLDLAHKLGFDTVHRKNLECGKDRLSKFLMHRKNKSKYEMDGLVLVDSDHIFRYSDSDKPKWTIAFKENLNEDSAPTTKVLDVIWQASSVGRLTPKIEIEPVRLDGVTVKYCTAHNAKWLVERGIGPGAKIKIVRSGGVIPKIVGVVKESKKIKLPDSPYTEKGVHFFLSKYNEDVKIKNIEKFLTTCGVERIKYSTIEKLYKHGMDSLEAAARISSTEDGIRLRWLNLAGFKAKSSSIINYELKKLQKIHIIDSMVGSGIWDEGLGRRRLEAIAEHMRLVKLLTNDRKELKGKIADIPGFGIKTAKMIVAGLDKYADLHAKLVDWIHIDCSNPVKISRKGKYTGFFGCWTGYRDKTQEADFEKNGGVIIPFGKKVTHLFYKEGGKTSSKVERAGDRALTWEQFINSGN